jgi:cytochrome c peroxidase
MKKLFCISVILLVAASCGLFSCKQKTPAPEKTIAQELLIQIDSFSAACQALDESFMNGSAGQKELQELFLRARLAYKKIEWATEYFVPATSRGVNGPPVPEVEISGAVIEPAGLQVIEGLLFPTYDTSRKKQLTEQLSLLQSDCVKYKTHFANIDIFDWQVFDAAKLELFRIMTLGITGFDNPLTLKSMPESATALESLQHVLAFYGNQEQDAQLHEDIESAIKYLLANTDFNSFNRMAFIMDHANAVTTGISNLEEKLQIHVIRYNRLVNQDAKTLFDTNTFNVNAYAPDQASFISDEKVALGKKLFSDPILSGSGKRSCQSCHQPEKAFTDGLVKNTVIDETALLGRNTPTLINAALQPALFYDSRVGTLEDQSHTVVQSNTEMHGSMQLSVQQLWKDTMYRRLFLSAFPQGDRNRIDTFEVMNAIGSFIRSLTFLNSRFDEYMRGNKTAMNAVEINGFNLFMGKAKCATCHYMPLFNGTFPPRFVKIESEVIGVPKTIEEKEIDTDLGSYAIVKNESFRHAFKISTVRNAARTAPYMHNGVFTSLEQVLDFYDKGGGMGLGLRIKNQTLPSDKLGLNQQERVDIIAFIKSLDSR